ncbi:MAG: PKD domain-containing protein, partial [Flavobacteriales bacterium]|nr:PKD domain-containing protein [Flavobacteriales bacterium]
MKKRLFLWMSASLMTVQIGFSQCITQNMISVTYNPPPVNGAYNPGQTVQICVTLSGFNQLGANWLHGCYLSNFGNGWNPATYQGVSAPQANTGQYIWASNFTSTAFGAFITNPGWYFDLNYDGNPGNNYGQSNSNGPYPRTFCFQITTTTNCGGGNTNLSFNINITSDGQTGSWPNAACGPIPSFAPPLVSLNCGPSVTLTPTHPSCHNACNGAIQVQVTGGTPPYSYSWNQGPGGSNPTGLCAGTYTVTVTDNNGLTAQGSVTLNNPAPVPAPNSFTTSACQGQSVILTGSGSPSGQYNWYSDPQGNNLLSTGPTYTIINATQSATYYAQSIQGNCTSTLTPIQVTIHPLPTVLVAGDNTICLGTNLSLDASGSSVAAPSTITQYAWDFTSDGTTDFSSANPTASATLNQPGNYTATLTVTATGGCTGTGTFNYSIVPLPTADFSWPANICSSTIQLDGSASSAQAPQTITTYAWDFDNNGTADQSLNQPTVSHTFPSSGNHTVSLTVTTNEGCTDQVTHTINIPSALTVQIISSTDISCFGASDGSATALASGGSGNYSYSWNTNPPQTTATATGLPAGTYTVTATDAANCTAAASVTINDAAPLNVSIVNVQHVSCAGGANGQATAQVTGGTNPISYSWNTTPAQNTATATNLPAGTWTVTVTDANNCIGTASAQITEPQPLVVQASSVNVTCFGQNNGQLSAAANGGTGTITYSWNTVPPTNSQTVNNVPPGNYTVTATDQNGCQATAQATVTQPTQILLQTNHTNVNCPGGTNGSATVQGSGGTGALTFTWNTLPPTTGNSVNNLPAGTYTVIATD